MRRTRPALILAVLGVAAAMLAPAASGATAKPGFFTVKLDKAAGGTEPRASVDPAGKRWVVTNSKSGGDAVVYGSTNGKTWTQTTGTLGNQLSATIDTDIVTTRTGRIIASELDFTGIRFITGFSDDGGKTWTASTGMPPADSDRQWLAVGPDDATTHLPRVYLLWHNLLSGTGNHNMWVQTSTDNGATFGAPVPTTLPGDEAYGDLQCADSGGPSGIAVDQKTGRIYVAFGTRSGPAVGGCTASVVGPFEINVVSATRVWVASSPDNAAGSWKQSLAVDRSTQHQEKEQIVGMELSPLAVDLAGNVIVAFPESKSVDDFTAAAKYVWSPPGATSWSKPRTIAPLKDAGNILIHPVGGDAGRWGFAYMHGLKRAEGKPQWYSEYAVTTDGMSSDPHFQTVQLSNVPTYAGTAAVLMAQCGSGPAKGVENGFNCSRSADVYGIAMDLKGGAVVVWPGVSSAGDGSDGGGTYVASQLSGVSLLKKYGGSTVPGSSGSSGGVPGSGSGSGSGSSGSGSGGSGLPTTGAPALLGLLALGLLASAAVLRRRTRATR
ncbi:MAG: repeat-like domain [Frankiaceae bacterium]|nr:repeat-like domain [Frankiaceae bacterium]